MQALSIKNEKKESKKERKKERKKDWKKARSHKDGIKYVGAIEREHKTS